MYKKLFYTLLIINVTLKADEVSVFGAGNLDSKNPYGLNSAEKNILKNRKNLGTIDSKVKNVKLTIESISERVDGLKSIYEGDSRKLNKTILSLNKLIKNVEENSTLIQEHSKDIKDLKNVSNQILTLQEEISSENKKNIAEIKKIILSLTKKINSINSTYVSEKEFKSNMKQFITRSEFKDLKKSLDKKISSKNTILSKTKKVISSNDKAKMLSEAKSLFEKDYFTKAIPIFEKLVALDYKRATSNFYLGEIWYYRKNYKSAISYFKTSAVLYDKASYMPKLLLHSAICFEKVGDFTNAAKFYSSLVNVYPKSEEANIATKNLSNIK